MKKVILAVTLMGIFASTTAMANDASGFRVGVGMGFTEHVDEENKNGYKEIEEISNTFIVEGGYEFNGIVGVKGKYSYLSANESETSPTGEEWGSEGDIHKLIVTTDLGYTFTMAENHNLKPYIEAGVFGTYGKEDDYKETNTGLIAGVGIRYNYNRFYADFAVLKEMPSNVHGESVYDEIFLEEGLDGTSANLTVGYSF